MTVPNPEEHTGIYKEVKNTAWRIDCCVVWDFALCVWRQRQWKQKQQNQFDTDPTPDAAPGQ